MSRNLFSGYEDDLLSLYDEEHISLMLENDEIDAVTEGFMRGYVAS